MASQKSLIVFAALLLTAATIEAVKITDCAQGEAGAVTVKSLTVKDCDLDKDPVCNFHKGTNASIAIDFVATEQFKKADVRINGILGPLPMPFPINPSDACGHYGFNCPVAKGDRKTLKLSLPILPVYPRLSLKCQLKLLNEMNRPILCIEFPIKIVN